MNEWSHTSTPLHYIKKEKFTFYKRVPLKKAVHYLMNGKGKGQGKGKGHPRTSHEDTEGE